MKIIFVRHGAPDYKTDTLLDVGRLQAEAVAKRLECEGIDRIYSSTHGRAIETAEPLARLIGLEVLPYDFLRELNWGNKEEQIPFDGHPWNTVLDMVKQGLELDDNNWEQNENFAKNVKLKQTVARLEAAADDFIASFGYVREGAYYRAREDASDETIAIFSHAGASSAFMSHLISIPLPRFLASVSMRFTSVCIIEISGKAGELCNPRILLLSDDKHFVEDNFNDVNKK